MTNKDIRDLEMLIRVRQFGASHTGSFPADSRGVELLAVIDTEIKAMEGQASAQDSGKRAAKEKTVLKNVALDDLCGDLEVMSRTARAMSLTIPGVADKFRVPQSMAVQSCLAAARSFAADAEPLKAEFIRRGLSRDFFDGFGAKITALEDSVNSKAQKTGARVAATVAVSGTAKRGRNAVRELDAIVRNLFREDPSALAEWESASHVERAPHHAAVNPPAPNTTAKE